MDLYGVSGLPTFEEASVVHFIKIIVFSKKTIVQFKKITKSCTVLLITFQNV